MEAKQNRTNTQVEQIQDLKEKFKQHMLLSVAHNLDNSSALDKYTALVFTIRDKLIEKWIRTQDTYYRKNPKRVYYFSLEFLMGRTLGNALLNLDLSELVEEAMAELGYALEDLEEIEWDAGLGNGGLGRLAACFLDSMATLELPAYGFGIRYEYGMFKQTITENGQEETPDNWLRYGNPWEYQRAEDIQIVQFYGKTNSYFDKNGTWITEWIDTDNVVALGYDYPIPGYKTDTVNSLKLWSATSSREFNLQSFNTGDYVGAIVDKHQSEVLSKVLYPNDTSYQGKELRLKQQYFMVSASLRNIIARLERCGDKIADLPRKVVIQLNDTHPAIAIPELIRICLDEYLLDWDTAWDISSRTFAYTNHTVLPEALEKWPVDLVANLLPRHMEIIYEINHRFLDDVNVAYPGDFDRRSRMSIIEEGDCRNIRMANLAIIGSYSVNGVAELHTELLKKDLFQDFFQLYTDKFNNKTNGVTPRRWLKKANPDLSALITEKIGSGWVKDLASITQLEELADDADFINEWREVKLRNKKKLAKLILKLCGVTVDPSSMFDTQIKRIHEYKRQLLNVLHVITLYKRIKEGKTADLTPRTIIFGGKAAPGYARAKEIIYLIHCVACQINNDPAVNHFLKVVFIPNYGVSLAEKIFPGSDLSEQISTAGMEASGTGNMKFALNGALTIGTLDGANIEIKDEVGDENIFIFGKTVDELVDLRSNGYDPFKIYKDDDDLSVVLNWIRDGFFNSCRPKAFVPIFNSLTHEGDHYFNLVDYRSYIRCQDSAGQLYLDPEQWHRKAILNVARQSKFSSDRTIRQYAEEIWNVQSCPAV